MATTAADPFADVHRRDAIPSQPANDSLMDSYPSHGRHTLRYDLKTTNLTRTKASLTPSDNQGNTYTAQLSFLSKEIVSSSISPSVILHRSHSSSSTTEGDVVGSGVIDILSEQTPALFKLGPLPQSQFSPSPASQEGEQPYIPLPLFTISSSPSQPPKEYEWKRTTKTTTKGGDKEKETKKDWLNLKLEDKQTGEIVAKFVHNFWVGSKRGYFAVLVDGGENSGGGDGKGLNMDDGWIEVVLLSGLVYLEYQRKVSGWSW